MRRGHWLILLIIIIAAFLRLWNFSPIPPGLYPDEAMNGNNALEAIASHDWKVFYPENNGREGLFINIQSASIAMFGNEPWALRLPSAIFGILTVLGIYFLTKELFRDKILFSPKPPQASGHGSSDSERASRGQASASLGQRSGLRENEILALVVAFLLATSFWHINFSRIGFRAIMAPAFLTWGIYFLLLYLNRITEEIKNLKLKTKNYSSKGKTLWLAALAGVIYGLGMHSYIAYRATPLLILFIIAAYWFKNKDRLVRKQILLSTFYFLFSSIIVFLPLGIHFLNNPADFFGRTTQISVFGSPAPLRDLALNTVKTLGMFNFFGDYNWRHNIAGKPELSFPVGVMFLVGVFIAIKEITKSLKRKAKSYNAKVKTTDFSFSFLVLTLWLLIAMLPVVISNEGLPHALRAIIMIPPVFILSGVGGMAIYNFFARKVRSTPVLKTASFILLLYILLNTYYTYFIRWAKSPNTADAFAANYIEIGRKLNSLPAEQPKYVIVNASGADVRGLPMPTQTVMFITDTFNPEKQKQKNIYYLPPQQFDPTTIPPSAFTINLD